MKIAIYGGSYNPIHKGHTELAQSLVRQGLVDQVWLMVSPLNPLKESNRSEYASYDDRVRMAQLATADIDGVVVSDFERTLPLPSYTITTLNALEQTYPQHQFVLVVGGSPSSYITVPATKYATYNQSIHPSTTSVPPVFALPSASAKHPPTGSIPMSSGTLRKTICTNKRFFRS